MLRFIYVTSPTMTSAYNTTGYSCSFCSREYKEKFNYDRHYVYCTFINKSLREQNDVIETNDTLPTMKQMYRWMQEMAVRIDKLEKENTKLKSIQAKKTKMNIIEWLNNSNQTYSREITFADWLTTTLFPLIPNLLEKVYETDLLTGIIAAFKQAIANTPENKMPIRSFDSKPNTLYALCKVEPSPSIDEVPSCNSNINIIWRSLTTDEVDCYLRRITKQFTVEFYRCWCLVHKDKIETDEKYNDKYVHYYQQILGSKMSDETRFSRIRHSLYEHIKQYTKQIIEYE